MTRQHHLSGRTMISTSDGVRLHVLDEGSGPPVVLLPGYGAAAQSWVLQVEALRDRFRLVAVDHRSHGRSERPAFGQRMSRYAEDLRDVLDAFELADVLLVGTSMGASVALAYVDAFGCDRLRGLVLVDQTPKMVNDDHWQLGYPGLTWEGVDAWVARFPDGVGGFHRTPDPELLARLAAGPQFSVDDTRALLRDHTCADWRGVLPRVTVPLTAVAGRHSPVWPWESARWMADAAPDGRLVLFEGSGHFPMVEEAALFNHVLLEVAS